MLSLYIPEIRLLTVERPGPDADQGPQIIERWVGIILQGDPQREQIVGFQLVEEPRVGRDLLRGRNGDVEVQVDLSG